MHCKKMTRFVHTVKKTENQKMPYFSNEKRYRKNSKGFELQRANLSKQNVDVSLTSRQRHVNVCKR